MGSRAHNHISLKGPSKQGIAHFVELAKAARFDVVAQKGEKGWFYLELKKKD